MAILVFQVSKSLCSMVEHPFHRWQDIQVRRSVPCATINHCSGSDQKVCIHGLLQYKWPELWLASQQYCFSRCIIALQQWWGILHRWKGIPVEPISNVCHYSVLRKCVFMVWLWSTKMASMLTGVHGNAVFPGVKEPCGCGGACCMDEKVVRWSQSAL